MWSRDIHDGEAAERLVADYLLHTTHRVVHKAMGDFSDYDLIGDGVTYEVKNDRRARATGNIAIEYEYKGEHSGVLKTKAQVWAHIISDNECLMFPTHKLRDWLRLQQQYLKRVESGEHAKSLLVSIEEIVGRDFCDVIDLYADTAPTTRLANAQSDTQDENDPVHVHQICPADDGGGTSIGGDETAQLPEDEHTDDDASEKLRVLANNLGSG